MWKAYYWLVGLVVVLSMILRALFIGSHLYTDNVTQTLGEGLPVYSP